MSVSLFFFLGNCPDGHFSVAGRCVPCFCSGITKNCQSTGRYRSQIALRFTEEENFKGSRLHDAHEVLDRIVVTHLTRVLYVSLYPLHPHLSGVNVSFPSRPGTPPPLSSTQMIINPDVAEFQLVDLSRRFLDLESYWTLPRQFLGSKVCSHSCRKTEQINSIHLVTKQLYRERNILKIYT